MSGDVQPRKRKDKKRKKDELGVEEPRGTAAVLGEGDVFMHSPHEHGTGGHWCAKIIFFSLLAILVALIGLIILENRGLTDLEAKSVESRYSGVLEGWIEDTPDDDHHDEHTLELKHHDDIGDHDEPSQEIDQEDEEDQNHVDEHEEIGEQDDENDQGDHNDEDEDDDDQDDQEDDEVNENDEDDENSEEHSLDDADDEDEDEEPAYRRYVRSTDHQKVDDEDDGSDDDDLQNVDEYDSIEDNDDNDQDEDQSAEGDTKQNNDDENDEESSLEEQQALDDDDDDDEEENDDNDVDNQDDSNEQEDENDTRENEDEEEHDEEEADSGVEVEKLEKEISDEDALSTEEPAQTDSKEDNKDSEESVNEVATEDDNVDDEEEYLELDDIDEPPPVVEHIKVPAGKPLAEVEEGGTSEKPPDTLAEEEEYERRQEELRREKAEASHVWLKLVVGGALLVATHAVVRRATAPRDTPDNDEHASREETPVIDRRMTLIPEETASPAITTDVLETIDQPEIEEEILETVSSAVKSTSPVRQESEEVDDVEEIEIETKDEIAEPINEETIDKELYSDEEDEEDDEEEIVVEEKVTPKLITTVSQKPVEPEPEPEPELEDEEVPDDVEIIDDEQLDEELEEEEEEEDISDVDDAELLSRLEAKYGRLPMPEPDRPGQKHKDGGNSIEDDWPGEPSDAYWRQQLDQAEQEMRQGEWSSASRRAGAAELSGSARAKWIVARGLDASAEARRDNALLSKAITAYLDLLKMNERLSDNKLRQITDRTLDRIRFRGTYLSAEPIYRLLIRRFPDAPEYRNNLTITFLMANRADLAEEVIKETLKRWPDDRVALAHHGFILKTQHNRLEEAVDAFQKALKDDTGPATESRFYYHLGDSLLLLGRHAEAHEVHKRGAALGHFLSPAQRSLYNVDRLKGQPWWSVEQTPYLKLAHALEKSWKEILKEGKAAKALYEQEKEGLKERGEWSQLDLFVRGQEIPNRCKRAPVTCSIVRSEPAAAGCRRGQIKFSSMEPGTHVRPHVGPTNCRLRMHLGLSNTKDTYIRVDQETRKWQEGKVLLFDDSFEHEVWHNGTGNRLILIVDVWHPDLTAAERRSLPAI